MANEDQGSPPQRSLWGTSEAEHWQQDVERRRRDFAEATELMLKAAGLKTGDHVLDIAAGTGDQSLVAAHLVGPGGTILATDSSADMLTIAAQVAHQEGLTNITTRVMNAEQLDLEGDIFDAVICRLGLMLLPHPGLALSEIRRVLKPGGKLAALVWSAPERNPLWSMPMAILSKHTSKTTIPGPGPFALSDPRVFERELTEAGFHEISTRALPFASHYVSLDAFLHSTATRLIAGVLGQLSSEEQQSVLDEVRQAVSQFEETYGLVAPAELLLGVGSK